MACRRLFPLIPCMNVRSMMPIVVSPEDGDENSVEHGYGRHGKTEFVWKRSAVDCGFWKGATELLVGWHWNGPRTLRGAGERIADAACGGKREKPIIRKTSFRV